MASKLALGIVIGGAVSSTVGSAFKDVESRIKRLEATGAKARVLQNTIGDTIRLREEWRKAHLAGEKGASTLLTKLDANLASLKKQGIEVGRLEKAYQTLGRTARKAELKALGHQQIQAGRDGMKSTVGQAVGLSAAVAVPTKVSADYGAIIRDIAIKAGIANAPQEKQMSQTILQTSRDAGMGRNEVAQVVNSLVGAGMDLSEALSYAPTAAKFVVGQGAGAEDTAKMINALGQNAKITDPKVMQQALEAIAYQGQAGSFEASDMARWAPEMLAGMGKLGITGMDAVTQLGAMLQVQMKTAGGADEAANNLKNWMEKIGARDTVTAYKKAGIDYQGSMQTGLQKGMSTLEASLALAQRYVAATDPAKAKAMAEATAKINKETDPVKAKAMIDSLEQALRTGDIFADMQVKAALTAYTQNKALYEQLKNDSKSATGILDKNLAERREASAQKWAEMAQSMDDSMRMIGDAIRPMTDGVADGLAWVGRGLSSLGDESPKVVSSVAAITAGLIGFRGVVNSVKIGRGLLNIARGGLRGGDPNTPQRVIVTNMPAGGLDGPGMDAGDSKRRKKTKKSKPPSPAARAAATPPTAAPGSARPAPVRQGVGMNTGGMVKGTAVFAAVDSLLMAKDTYDNAETRDEMAEGYGEAAGNLAGTLAGAAAGAAIGSMVPVIGTVVGGLIGAYLGSTGGQALGGYAGKAMFGSDPATKVMPAAGPLMMADAGKNIPPVLGDIAASFKAPPKVAPPVPLMLQRPPVPAPGPTSRADAVTQPGRNAAPVTLAPATVQVAPGRDAAPVRPLAPVVQTMAPPATVQVVPGRDAAPVRPLAPVVQMMAPPATVPAVPGRDAAPGQPVLPVNAPLGPLRGAPGRDPSPVLPLAPVVRVTAPAAPAGPSGRPNRPPLLLPVPLVVPASGRKGDAPAPALMPDRVLDGQGVTRNGPGSEVGDLVRALAQAQAVKPGAALPKPVPPVKPERAKFEQVVHVTAPFSLTVKGDVKDPQQLAREIEPYLQNHRQEISRQLSSASLFDEPHVG
ncbi:phage tail tape measure protein [Pseudomonas sp.]|uniref:phage tail tape measure protein n=1 Tax=Pseudomonas sp. TaxID=306 RepID=UPI001992C328|nr:phage tail tape measure protein [Pseudomonas sp.]MBC6626161.1 phage tail tape measure protein [Pseudomonas sp.]